MRLIGNETGLYRPLKPDDENKFVCAEAVSAVILAAIMGYLYIFNINDFDRGSINTMTKANAWNAKEIRFHDVIRVASKL